MPKIVYQPKRFRENSLEVIEVAEAIINEYAVLGYDLTLRQLYYQFVARELIANTDTEYKRLGKIINDARMAGLIDWEAIVDRTRYVRSCTHWSSPREILEESAEAFNYDKWEDQTERVEVWIEKDALVGVVEGVCQTLDVPCFSSRGYSSQSAMWQAAQRILGYNKDRQIGVILHLADHDPSGLDMTRDIEDRLNLFVSKHQIPGLAKTPPVVVFRAALTRTQVEEYGLPPNPAKLSDVRAKQYVGEHGPHSWELDALSPPIISSIVEGLVTHLRKEDLWIAQCEREAEARDQLRAAAREIELDD